ncbi:Chromosome segregation in meiosis protein 3 [Aspergillus saccharolyticus JOP 1030-1]|uniref:Chromosome segregation in meiosis protein n=1 Tax=Aspergillus saccharolyticus JOP 1030-1 TaxID=1450539 RepID=A0A318ZTG3_9EURO|nr:Swi3-domain-containing protein [Aspergillus saccharolyticus JOP 1030-1]PYH47270.1 Swi3-domain-containing protein [Aspergillus saccharolyticus JOP 1030-1]
MELETEPLNGLTSHDDSLFDYDAGLDATWKRPTTEPIAKPFGENSTMPILGVDDKVKVSKHRRFVAKLDESRLLSHSGIPKLRRTSRQRLRLKGKGHEYSDVARLLNFYQLWLDNLYPRAKFADGLAIIEKLGHSKRMQTMRREWIDEEKPKALAAEAVQMPQLAHLNKQTSDGYGKDNDIPFTVETFDTSISALNPGGGHGNSASNLVQPHATDRESNQEKAETGIEIDASNDDELEFLLREYGDSSLDA